MQVFFSITENFLGLHFICVLYEVLLDQSFMAKNRHQSLIKAKTKVIDSGSDDMHQVATKFFLQKLVVDEA